MGFNSTIITKKKMLKCGHFDYAFSRGRCAQCAKIEDFNKKQEKEIESEGLADLIKDADALFSRYIRIRAIETRGEASCYTCGVKTKWQQLQCGHYISRKCIYLRFDPRNARVQCEYCNCHKHGNLLVYGKKLELENPGITEILYEESKIVFHITKEELRSIISELTDKINRL